jgi:hypothetical protein
LPTPVSPSAAAPEAQGRPLTGQQPSAPAANPVPHRASPLQTHTHGAAPEQVPLPTYTSPPTSEHAPARAPG